MTLSRVYELLRELKCAMALEIAERLGISRKAVQTYLNRLAAKGLVEKRTFGRRAVIYCVRGDGGRGDIKIVDSAETHTIRVNLPSDLAAALEGADVNETVLQALEQLFQRYRP